MTTTANRRAFLAAALALPLLPQLRERRLGCGHHSRTGELLHEAFAVERWTGREWSDTFERRLRWRQGNEWQERRYKLKRPELGF